MKRFDYRIQLQLYKKNQLTMALARNKSGLQ